MMLQLLEEGEGTGIEMIWCLPGGGVRRFSMDRDGLALHACFAPFPVVHEFVDILLGARPRAVEVEALSGVSAELARVAMALGFKVAVRLPEAARVARDARSLRWLGGLLGSVSRCLPPRNDADEVALRAVLPGLPACVPAGGDGAETAFPAEEFGYEAYAFGNRDHNLLLAMQACYATHFSGCGRVLDLGCGTGVFLEVLARQGLAATGVERNAMSVRYARSLGHEVVEADALDFLAAQEACWDGVYCSHFVEHLPVDAVQTLLRRVAAALRPGGVALFVFPDPESIRSQLLGFWRDPEHVRFYHPELVAIMAAAYGLAVEFDSQKVPGRRVVSFEPEPPLPLQAAPQRPGLRERVLRRLGIAPATELAAQRARADALERAVRELWAVNQTWAWEDNAVLRLRKTAGNGEADGG